MLRRRNLATALRRAVGIRAVGIRAVGIRAVGILAVGILTCSHATLAAQSRQDTAPVGEQAVGEQAVGEQAVGEQAVGRAESPSRADKRSFPALGYVVSEAAHVRESPSFESYVCDHLTRGQRVEIHRREGEWLAIRPTARCYSWIRADLVEVTRGRLGRVLDSGSKVWVGSLDGVAEHNSQIQLEHGDSVIVLESSASTQPVSKSTGNLAEKRWLKVAPPDGEFRWIHEKRVHMPRASRNSRLEQTRDDRSDWSQREPSPKTAELRPSNRSPPFQEEIVRMRLALAKMVIRPIEDWEMPRLRADFDDLTNRSRTTWQRAQLARLAESFGDVESQYDEFLALDSGPAPQTLDIARLVRVAEPIQLPSSARVARSPRPQKSLEIDQLGAEIGDRIEDSEERLETGFVGETFRAHYDLIGRIMPIYSEQPRTPPYGVLDDDGRLLALLTPTPGFNVRRYKGERVGIIGRTREMSSKGKQYQHITAEKVIMLDRQPTSFPLNLAKLPWMKTR
jgi:hypothetical protein